MPPDPDSDPTAEQVDPMAVGMGGPGGQGAAAVPPQGLRHAVRAFKHRDYAIFWSGALASNTGTWVQNLTVPYVLYQLTDSAFWVGVATFAQFIPGMVLGPLGGSIADRFDRRRVLLATQALMAMVAFLLWAAWVADFRSLPVILGIVTLSGVIAGINIPSWQSFVNDMVPRDDLLSAVTLNSLQFNAARAIGPTIGGFLLANYGPSWAFLVNALSYVCVLLALLVVRTRPARRGSPLPGGVLSQFRRAVRYTRTQPGIVLGVAVAVLVGFLGNPVQQFTVIFAEDEFRVSAQALGFLNMALGVGAVASAPLVSGWDQVISRASLVRIGLPIYGASIVAFALSPVYAVGLVALVGVGAGFLIVISTTNTAVQVIVADHVRGRVMALRIMAFTGSYPLGALIQGTIADRIGARPTVAGAGLLIVAAGVYLAVLRPGLLARLDDRHDERPPGSSQPAAAG
ncbi:MAG: MFS transporter [Acidimicrobiia bacterium]|nr:MFS transporter [Acidimicrobiia bacterium]